jgi:hypothetical protein
LFKKIHNSPDSKTSVKSNVTKQKGFVIDTDIAFPHTVWRQRRRAEREASLTGFAGGSIRHRALTHHPGASRHPSWPGGVIRVPVRYVIALFQRIFLPLQFSQRLA